MQRAARTYEIGLLTVVVFLLWAPQIALSQPAPPVDQNKLFWQAPPGWYILHYNDANGNLCHDPGEPWLVGGDSTHASWKPDYTCWMASATNLLVYSGFANPYVGWLGAGVPPDPNMSVWGNWFFACGPGAMTFDDGGWQDWGLANAGVAFLVPIRTVPEFGGIWQDAAGNPINPINWCKARLDTECVPVGLTCWWHPAGAPYDEAPGPIDPDLSWGYHAITLWDINVAAGTVTITDSDDEGILGTWPVPIGARVAPYAFGAGIWTVNLYPGVIAQVNYAVAIAGGGPSATEETTWGQIKAEFGE